MALRSAIVRVKRSRDEAACPELVLEATNRHRCVADLAQQLGASMALERQPGGGEPGAAGAEAAAGEGAAPRAPKRCRFTRVSTRTAAELEGMSAQDLWRQLNSQAGDGAPAEAAGAGASHGAAADAAGDGGDGARIVDLLQLAGGRLVLQRAQPRAPRPPQRPQGGVAEAGGEGVLEAAIEMVEEYLHRSGGGSGGGGGGGGGGGDQRMDESHAAPAPARQLKRPSKRRAAAPPSDAAQPPLHRLETQQGAAAGAASTSGQQPGAQQQVLPGAEGQQQQQQQQPLSSASGGEASDAFVYDVFVAAGDDDAQGGAGPRAAGGWRAVDALMWEGGSGAPVQHHGQELDAGVPVIEVSDDWDEDQEDDAAAARNPDHDSDDSNAESYYANSYPDEDQGYGEDTEDEAVDDAFAAVGALPGRSASDGELGSADEGGGGSGSGDGLGTYAAAGAARGGCRRAGVISDGDDEDFDVDDYDSDAEAERQYASAAAWRRELVNRAMFPPPPPLPDA